MIGPGFGRTVGGFMDSLMVPIVTIPFVPGIVISLILIDELLS